MEKIIEQIHHDINTAYLTKIQSCKEYIDRNEVNSDELLLASLGFKSYENEAIKDEKLKKSKDYISLINRLKIDYPYKKFIKYEDLGPILKKYDLVLDTPNRFIGKIPKLNQRGILNFKLKSVDEGYNVTPQISISCDNNKSTIYEIVNILLNEINKIMSERSFLFISMRENKPRSINDLFNNLKKYDENLVNEIIFKLTDTISKDFFKDLQNILVFNSRIKNYFNLRGEHFILEQRNDLICVTNWYTENRNDLNISVYPKETSTTCNFWVLATADQFNISSNEFVIGGKIVKAPEPTNFQIRLKDDPIILKPIKEGLIIVSLWGDEASLPEFINPDNN